MSHFSNYAVKACPMESLVHSEQLQASFLSDLTTDLYGTLSDHVLLFRLRTLQELSKFIEW